MMDADGRAREPGLEGSMGSPGSPGTRGLYPSLRARRRPLPEPSRAALPAPSPLASHPLALCMGIHLMDADGRGRKTGLEKLGWRTLKAAVATIPWDSRYRIRRGPPQGTGSFSSLVTCYRLQPRRGAPTSNTYSDSPASRSRDARSLPPGVAGPSGPAPAAPPRPCPGGRGPP
jgi:hypothetical protein